MQSTCTSCIGVRSLQYMHVLYRGTKPTVRARLVSGCAVYSICTSCIGVCSLQYMHVLYRGVYSTAPALLVSGYEAYSTRTPCIAVCILQYLHALYRGTYPTLNARLVSKSVAYSTCTPCIAVCSLQYMRLFSLAFLITLNVPSISTGSPSATRTYFSARRPAAKLIILLWFTAFPSDMLRYPFKNRRRILPFEAFRIHSNPRHWTLCNRAAAKERTAIRGKSRLG